MTRTSALCQPQNWRKWAGYYVVGSYEHTIDREYWAIRHAAALIDVTPLIKYIIQGKDAAALLHRVTTRDIYKMKVGQVAYTGWCDDVGKLIDDGTVSRLEEQTFRLTAAEPNLRWLMMNAVGMDVSITEVTDDVAALSFQGPNSRVVLNKVAEKPVDELKYFRLMKNKINGRDVTISRTGYTGESRLRDLDGRLRRDQGLGRVDGDGSQLRHPACRHPCHGHRACRGGLVHARGGLHLPDPCVD